MSAELRVKRVIGYYGRFLFYLFVALGVIAAVGAGYVYATPPSETVTEQTNVQELETSVRTSAVVTGNTTFYPAGQRLVDQPAYLVEATPNLTFESQTTVPAGTDVTVSHRLTLVQAATRGDEPFWTSTRVILAEERTVGDGSTAANATINMSAVAQEIRSNRERLEAIGGYDTRVEMEVAYETDRYSGTLTASSPITVSERAYWLDDDLRATRTHSEPVTRTVSGEPNIALVALLGALSVSGLAAAGGISVVSRRGIDVDEIELQLDLERFDEWITTSEIPTDPDKRYVRTTSLEGLVDIAIDSKKRVLHDPESDIYTVVTDDIVYYYAQREGALTSWFSM
ncbi:DUF5305 domain-containing protein [Halobellus captivus]|uniref:DUF5305 domain-containing protein n=1 Tax=Halobellus captivus TaxID=2592614 RepID=UPI0011A5C35D|nr:DUF5305 domain-containing protein [Halobellus captivus]